MKASLINPSKPVPKLVEELDRIFMEDSLVVPVGYEEVQKIPRNDLRVYCNIRGIYTIVTTELVEWLKGQIDENTIEIGSGNGTLGRALGIPTTDNRLQEDSMIAMQYLMMGQRPIQYPNDIEKLDGIEAIKKYKPSMVIGSWITHKWRVSEPELEGNAWAPDEEEIMSLVDTYMMIGNMRVHANNRLLDKRKYKVHAESPPYLVSRAENPEADMILTFQNK
jgi:hypothetical protein